MEWVYDVHDNEIELLAPKEKTDTLDIPASIDDYIVTTLSLLDKNIKHLKISETIKEINIYDRYHIDLESIEVHPDNPYFSSLDGVLYNKDKTQLIIYPEKKKDIFFKMPDSVQSICYDAFIYNEYLQEVIMSDAIKEIPPHAFCGCSNLVTIHLSDHLEKIDYWAFYRCYKLRYIHFPNTLKDIGNMAFEKTDLHELVIPQSIVNIDNAFGDTFVIFYVYENSYGLEYAKKERIQYKMIQ